MRHLLVLSSASFIALMVATGPGHARDQIRIVGSSTVFPFSTAVAEQFGRTTNHAAPVVESTGTGGGFQLFCGGLGERHPDISNSSRQIKESEVQACAQNGVDQITEVKIGYDGIVLANSKQSEPMSITIPQLWQALAMQVPQDGRLVDNPYRTWNEIDASLPNKPIEVMGPPPTSGTRDAFVELVMDVGCEEVPAIQELEGDAKQRACQTMREDGRYINAGENDNLIVQRLEANPDAFGIFGFSFLDQNVDRLQGSTISGEEPTFENIADGDYPVSRSLFFYVKNAHVGVVPGIQGFVAEFVSPAAVGENGYLADKGLIPLHEEEREEVRRRATSLEPMASSAG